MQYSCMPAIPMLGGLGSFFEAPHVSRHQGIEEGVWGSISENIYSQGIMEKKGGKEDISGNISTFKESWNIRGGGGGGYGTSLETYIHTYTYSDIGSGAVLIRG